MSRKVLLFFRQISTGMNRSIWILPEISGFSVQMVSVGCFHLVFSITRFYVFFEETINIKGVRYMGYDQYTVSNDCSCRTYFCCFLLALANVCPWPLVLFFQNSLENRADKTTHNTFRDCRVRFFRQPFSKQLYTKTVDSVFRALWLATQSVNILHYSLIHLQFLRASDAKLA